MEGGSDSIPLGVRPDDRHGSRAGVLLPQEDHAEGEIESGYVESQ